MPVLTKRTDSPPSLTNTLPNSADQLDLEYCGEAIGAGDACYIRKANGKVYRSVVDATHNPKGIVHGFAAQAQRANKPITLFMTARFGYTVESGTGAAVPGQNYFLNEAVPGGLTDTAGSTATKAVAFGLDSGRIQVQANWNLY